MKNIIYILLFDILIFTSCIEKPKKVADKGIDNSEKTLDISSKFFIEILDNEALSIIDVNATIDVLASGFAWTEGPLWVEDGQYLLFSDIPNNKVYKLNTNNDTITYLNPSGISSKTFTGKEPGSNGLLLNNKGQLVLMQHGERRVGIMKNDLSNPNEDYISLVDNFKGLRFNSPNDGCFDKAGNLYFTDPPYGLPTSSIDDPSKEIEFQGIYCLLTSGELLLLDHKVKYPNGIALSNDEKSLYVAESNTELAVWYKYDVSSPGQVSNKNIFHDVTHFVGKEGEQGLPDGLKVNKQGILFATGPDGVWIFNPEGKVLARIHTGQKTANCALNSEENKLFMTADDYILAVDLK